jgi:hypothetical protein
MTRFANDFERLLERPRLYRVWVPSRADGTAPLVAIWIDRAMSAFEAQLEQDSIADSHSREAATLEKANTKEIHGNLEGEEACAI